MDKNLSSATSVGVQPQIDYVSKKYPYTTLMSWEFYEHKHSFWETIICLKGSAAHYINGVKYMFSAGDVIIMKPDSIHNYKIISKDGYAHYDFYSSASDMRRAAEATQPSMYAAISQAKSPEKFSVSPEVLGMLESKLAQLNSIQSGAHMQELSSCVYRTVLHTLLGLLSENLIMRRSDIPEWLSILLAQMSTEEVLSGKVADVVKLSGFSHGHLCRLFKKYTGETLSKYFVKLKIDYADVLLRNANLSILSISYMLGYDSLSHFISVFKKYNGTTPQQFRKKMYGNAI